MYTHAGARTCAQAPTPSHTLTPQRSRILVVFDCNGTLTSLTEDRKRFGSKVRPGVIHLKKLFANSALQLALWTSAQRCVGHGPVLFDAGGTSDRLIA